MITQLFATKTQPKPAPKRMNLDEEGSLLPIVVRFDDICDICLFVLVIIILITLS